MSQKTENGGLAFIWYLQSVAIAFAITSLSRIGNADATEDLGFWTYQIWNKLS